MKAIPMCCGMPDCPICGGPPKPHDQQFLEGASLTEGLSGRIKGESYQDNYPVRRRYLTEGSGDNREDY